MSKEPSVKSFELSLMSVTLNRRDHLNLRLRHRTIPRISPMTSWHRHIRKATFTGWIRPNGAFNAFSILGCV
jgi:hypothetical protein